MLCFESGLGVNSALPQKHAINVVAQTYAQQCPLLELYPVGRISQDLYFVPARMW